MASKKSEGRSFPSSAGSDGYLIEMVRGGDLSAFGELYERHVSVASAVALRNLDNRSDAEDIVAEAFQAVLQSLVSGKGPDTFFRAYLLSTVTRLSHHQNRKAGKIQPSDDVSFLDRLHTEPDPALEEFESRTVTKAFQALPERWQAVLWYLDVEKMKPAAVAPILGLSPNAVSAVALRAREGLRRQYIQAHIGVEPDSNCAKFVAKLGIFIRGGLSRTAEREMRMHLTGCQKCTAAVTELRDVQGTLRAALIPLVTGIPLAAWAGKGAGLSVLGGLAPAKATFVAPFLGQPALVAAVAAAGLGLALGAVGITDHLVPDTRMEQQPSEENPPHHAPSAMPPAPVPSRLPHNSLADTPALPGRPLTPTLEPKPPPAETTSSESPPPPAETTPSESPPPPAETTPSESPSVPSPGSAPPAAPSLGSPAAAAASLREVKHPDGSTSDMQIDFMVGGTAPLGPGKMVFSMGQQAKILESSLRAPEGWSCSLEGQTVATCVTESVQRSDLAFHVTAKWQGGRITFSLSGVGLTTSQFVYNR